MDRTILSFLLLCCLVGVVCCHETNTQPAHVDPGRPWCVANVNDGSITEAKFQGFIDYACGIVDCSAIQPGGGCYYPNLVWKHAAYALNLIYKTQHVCNREIGTITSYDPSYKGCTYP